MKHSLLIRGNPIVFNAELATAIGLNEAIVLQKIAFLLDRTESGKELKHDGERWLFNTYEQWQSQFFPFLSVHTVQRTFVELERKCLLISCQPEGSISRRKYYRIGEGASLHLNSERLDEGAKLASSRSGQIGVIDEPNRPLPLTVKSYKKTSVVCEKKQKGPKEDKATTTPHNKFVDGGTLHELKESWPNIDLPAEAKKARDYVKKERGPSAELEMIFFVKSWLPNAPQSGCSSAHRSDAEPNGWQEWVRDNSQDPSNADRSWNDMDRAHRDYIRSQLPA